MVSLASIFVGVEPDFSQIGGKIRRELPRHIPDSVGRDAGRTFGAGFLGSMSALAGPIAATAAGLGAVFAGGVAVAIGGLNRLGEIQGIERRFSTVFGEMAGSVRTFADGINERMGLSLVDVQGLVSGVQDLLIPLGFSREAAAAMSQETITMASALSEWTGGQVSATDAAGILTGAFLGEYDSLNQLGVAISAADVAAVLAAKGQSELTGEALKQAEALAVQELVMRNTTDAQAAYAEGASPATEAVNAIKAAFLDFKDRALVVLAPYLTDIATWAAERLPGALQVAEDWLRNTFIPALQTIVAWWQENGPAIVADVRAFVDEAVEKFGELSAWWTENGPTIEETFRALGDTAEDVAGFISDAWTAIELASELMGQAVFRTFGFIVNEALTFAQKVIGAAAAIIGVFDDDLAASLRGTQEDIRVTQEEWNAKVERMTRSIDLKADTTAARAELDALIKSYDKRDIALQANIQPVGIRAGDGPGAPPKGPGGNAHAVLRREIAALGGGMSISSGYRDPARNRAVGGSPTSYHMDKNNPAGDVVGPAAKLDALYARLRRVPHRELIWRAAGHYDHLHFAHEGGQVERSWPTLPGLSGDERPAVLQVGELVTPRGGIGDMAARIVDAIHQSSGHQTGSTVSAIHQAAQYVAAAIRPAVAAGRRSIDVGEESGISRAIRDGLMAAGWYGIAGDQREALYEPDWMRKFDSGGLLQPGVTVAQNNTGRPEMVLGPDAVVTIADASLEKLAARTAALLRNVVGGYDAAVGRQVSYGRMP